MFASGDFDGEDAIVNLHALDIRVAFSDIQGQPKAIFERFTIIPGLVDRAYCFENFAACSKWLKTYLAEESASGQSTGE